MKIAIVGATGSIGRAILQQILQRNDLSSIVAITRRPLPSTPRVHNAIIPDFGDLDAISDHTWSLIQDTDALIWAIGTYDLNKDVNFKYPLEFQKHLAKRLIKSGVRANGSRSPRFRFILLGGAFTETNQSRWLYFLPHQRRLKGHLQTKTLEFAQLNDWAAHVIRPGGVLIGGNTFAFRVAEIIFGSNLVIRGEELGTFVADLAVNGSERNVIENLEMVETGRHLVAQEPRKAR